MRRALNVLAISLLVLGGLGGPFACAGTWRWWPGLAFLIAVALGLAAGQVFVARRNPELRARRQRIGEGTPRWDLVWNALFWPLMIAGPLVAGLGVRFGWPGLPLACSPLGLAIVESGLALNAWAMATNRHFEGTVRIQREVGHKVVDAGPYARVRHPGYLGLILWALGTPLLLLSAAALVPALIVIAWIALRTALEDRFLQRELEGYAAYAARVRRRLVPGVW